MVTKQRRKLEHSWKLLQQWLCNTTDIAKEGGDNDASVKAIKASFEYHWFIVSTRSCFNLYAASVRELQEKFKGSDLNEETKSYDDNDGKNTSSNED